MGRFQDCGHLGARLRDLLLVLDSYGCGADEVARGFEAVSDLRGGVVLGNAGFVCLAGPRFAGLKMIFQVVFAAEFRDRAVTIEIRCSMDRRERRESRLHTRFSQPMHSPT